MDAPLHCSLLLELPKELEDVFWTHERTLRVYTTWDFFALCYTFVGSLLMARALWPALGNPVLVRYTWHLNLHLLVSIVACVIVMAVLTWWPKTYARHRHQLAMAQRLVRLAFMVLAALLNTRVLQKALAAAISDAAGNGRSGMHVAISLLTRPLFVSPIIAMTQGNWVFRTKYWLPIQLFNHLLVVHGSWRYLPCNMAAEPRSAVLLQPTCRAMTQLHQLIMGSLLGSAFGALSPPGSLDAVAACSDILSSARTLFWFMQAAYGVLILSTGFIGMEWRLKAVWVKEQLGKHLAYGPWGWPRSQHRRRGCRFTLQQCVTWVLGVPATFALLWCFCLWLVPLLPHEPCETCADAATCQPYVPCDGFWCRDPGLWAVVVIYLGMLFIGHAHLLHTLAFVGGLR